MAFPFCIFILHELLNFLLLSIEVSPEVSPSENIIVSKSSDSMKEHFFMAFLDFSFSILDFTRHKSLLVCKKVNDNKMLLYLFETLSSLQFIDLHFVHGLFQKEILMS